MSLKQKTAKITTQLEKAFGTPERKNITDPLSNLMLTILSQNTNDKNRDTAYERLKRIYPTWEDVMTAPANEIADAIRPGGLANQKSQRMKAILEWIKQEFGSLNLARLCEMKPDDVIEKFTQLNGIGVKTIGVVLMFSCGVDIFPVDTHVHRICRRLGLVPDNVSAEKTFWLMRSLVPEGKSFSLHMNFLKLGRTICRARKPACPECPLNNLCPYFAHHSDTNIENH